MSKDEIEHAGIEACAREFDIYLKTRIEQLNKLLKEARMEHRAQLKTERAEAEDIHAQFTKTFGRWL